MPDTVLIVDDDPAITAALMIRLHTSGYAVYHAINGLAGVEAAAVHRPNVIVMDIRMPDIDGFDACERIRRIPGLEHTPFVFLSAQVQDEAKRRALEMGGLFLSKPYEAADVINAIERVASHHPVTAAGADACRTGSRRF